MRVVMPAATAAIMTAAGCVVMMRMVFVMVMIAAAMFFVVMIASIVFVVCMYVVLGFFLMSENLYFHFSVSPVSSMTCAKATLKICPM